MAEQTIYETVKDLAPEDATLRLGYTFIYSYLTTQTAKQLHDVSWRKLKEMPHARKYLPMEEGYATTMAFQVRKLDKLEKADVHTLLRDLKRRDPPHSSIDGMIAKIAQETLYRPETDCWEDATVIEIGTRLLNALKHKYSHSTTPPDTLEEFYTMIDALQKESKPDRLR